MEHFLLDKILMSFLTLIFSLIFLNSAHAEWVNKTFSLENNVVNWTYDSEFNYPLVDLKGEDTYFIVHATNPDNWKHYGKNIDRVAHFNMSVGRPVVQLILTEETPLYLEKVGFKSFFFRGDSHRIIYSGRNSTWSGGNLTQCLCGGIWSILVQSEVTDTPLNLYLLTDSIYEIVDLEELSIRDPNERRLKTFFLNQLIEKIGIDSFRRYLETNFFVISNDYLCGNNGAGPLMTTTKTFRFIVFLNGRKLFTFGHGAQNVNINFMSTENYLSNK